MADFANSGRIERPLITVAGTMDALLPIDHHARAYARKVDAAGDGNNGQVMTDEGPAYRLYEVQNGNHIETYQDFFPQLEFIMPHAQRAFDLLVQHVEKGAKLPPDHAFHAPERSQRHRHSRATAQTCSFPETRVVPYEALPKLAGPFLFLRCA